MIDPRNHSSAQQMHLRVAVLALIITVLASLQAGCAYDASVSSGSTTQVQEDVAADSVAEMQAAQEREEGAEAARQVLEANAQKKVEAELNKMVGVWGYRAKSDQNDIWPALSVSSNGKWESELNGQQYSGDVTIEGEHILANDWYLEGPVYELTLGKTTEGRECLVAFTPGGDSHSDADQIAVLYRYKK